MHIADAVPLFHQHTLAPMLESATMLVEQYCAELSKAGGEKIQIIGYYHANERSDDHTLSPLAQKIADKIQAHYSDACILLVGFVSVVRSSTVLC